MSLFVSFGEIMLRLSPPAMQQIQNANSFDACYGGSEANVLACLSALGNKTAYLTALPATALGDATVKHLKACGVDTSHIIRKGDNMGMYFLEQGFGTRSSQVIYNRKNSEVTRLDANSFDFDKIFEGCTHFHICGISFALSKSSCELAFALLQNAKQRGIKTSFDFNYRAKLWSTEQAAPVYRKIIPFVDILFCSSLDLSTFLGTDIEHFYSNYSTELLIVREREIISSAEHSAKAAIYRQNGLDAECVATNSASFDVLDRIGSGDAFVGGVLHSLYNNPQSLTAALQTGMACFVLKHTLPGDTFTLNYAAVQAHIDNHSKDVSR